MLVVFVRRLVSEFSFCYFLPGGFLNATLCGVPPLSAMMPFRSHRWLIGWWQAGRVVTAFLETLICIFVCLIYFEVFDNSFGVGWVGGFLNTALPT